MLLIQNARIASENLPVLLDGDVLIVEGEIQKIGKKLAIPEGWGKTARPGAPSGRGAGTRNRATKPWPLHSR